MPCATSTFPTPTFSSLCISYRKIEARTFTIHDSTAKIALGCAAIFALHPTAPTLVSRTFSLASSVDEASNLLGTQGRISHSTIKRLSELFTSTKDDMIDGRSLMQHAITRLQQSKMKAITRLQHSKMKNISVRAGLELSLKMVLLDRIHLLYLEAISRIPKDELRFRHHRGLLKAGHCYGPFDPVTNIILNATWYDTMFPPKQHFKVEMICTKSLARIEFLSLCGLVAYLRVRFPTLSVYEALRRLLICNARLDSVIKMAKKEGHVEVAPFSQFVAYGIASQAAHHPSPTAQAKFITTLMPSMRGTIRSTLDVKRALSSGDVRTISETLSQISPPRKPLKKIQKLSKRATEIISAHQDKFKDCQGAIVEMAEASLLRYEKQTGQEYKLHFICDVNSTIPEYGVNYCRHSSNYPFCHMNIWARRRGSQNDDADQAPTLFFIQCRNNDGDMQDMSFLCCPILDPSKDAGRCYHCEYEGTKIIHPSSELYLGGSTDFEDMARGKTAVNTERLVEHGQMNTLFDHTLEDEDSIYFDPAWDVDFSVFINHTAKEQARHEELRKMKDYSWIEKLVRESSLLAAHS